MATVKTLLGNVFQSTPSAWRVTAVVIGQTMQISISIHTLRVEGDYLI